jgi:predicted transposase YbfD/YdcC
VTFGRKRLAATRGSLELPNGIPSRDTFERVFDRIKPQAPQSCFRDWVRAVSAALRIKHIAIDGRAPRGSASAKLGPPRLVSAWATARHLPLGQVAVEAKSGETTAIPALLGLLGLHGALVTIDAMGCQKAIARKIIGQGGHYALTAKDNQEHLGEDIQQMFLTALGKDFAGLDHDVHETRERGHGREERRCYTVSHATEGIRHAGAWAGLTTIGVCYSERAEKGETTTEVRCFIGDKRAGAKHHALGLRSHWGIENNLHWRLDVNFGEDGNRVQRRNAAENLALPRRLTPSLLKAHPSRDSIARERFAAALDTSFLEEILRGDGILGNR